MSGHGSRVADTPAALGDTLGRMSTPDPRGSEANDRLPRITIVTPSYQQASFLDGTIQSVVDQAYPALEYFVYDGGSTDGSAEIIAARSDVIDYWQSRPDGGQSAAINAGWARATGEILGWLNSDDRLAAGALRRVGQLFAEHPEIDLIYGRMDLVDPDGRVLGTLGEPYRRRTMLSSRNVVPQPAAFVRRSAFERVGPLDPSLRYVMDLDLWLRLADPGRRCSCRTRSPRPSSMTPRRRSPAGTPWPPSDSASGFDTPGARSAPDPPPARRLGDLPPAPRRRAPSDRCGPPASGASRSDRRARSLRGAPLAHRSGRAGRSGHVGATGRLCPDDSAASFRHDRGRRVCRPRDRGRIGAAGAPRPPRGTRRRQAPGASPGSDPDPRSRSAGWLRWRHFDRPHDRL